jgi:hypothetical protein
VNNLHKVVYQIVNSPDLVAQMLKNSEFLSQKFSLAPDEIQALLELVQNRSTMSGLLSAGTLQQTALSSWELVWIPPHYATSS